MKINPSYIISFLMIIMIKKNIITALEKIGYTQMVGKFFSDENYFSFMGNTLFLLLVSFQSSLKYFNYIFLFINGIGCYKFYKKQLTSIFIENVFS